MADGINQSPVVVATAVTGSVKVTAKWASNDPVVYNTSGTFA